MSFKNATPEEAGSLANLSGKVALVTGATSGIGEGVALALAFAGAYVVATGRDEKRGLETVRQIEAGKGKGHFDKLDVTVEDDWKRVVADIQKRFGRLDILVNNAGRGGLQLGGIPGIDGLEIEERYDLNSHDSSAIM